MFQKRYVAAFVTNLHPAGGYQHIRGDNRRRRLGLSTLAVFLSLIFWGSLLGPIGMVLCIPLTMTMKFACENNKST